MQKSSLNEVNLILPPDSVLNKNVSYFDNYTSIKARTINLFDGFLNWSWFEKEVVKIRETKDKIIRDELKAKLGAITPSGTFSERRSEKLIQHTNLLSFDIDFDKDNKSIPNFDDLLDHLANIKEVAYANHSISGKGYWGLVNIEDPAKHRYYFETIFNAFHKMGISLDASGKDICRLRGYSPRDEKTYFNHHAAVLKKYTEVHYYIPDVGLIPEPAKVTTPDLTSSPTYTTQNKAQLDDSPEEEFRKNNLITAAVVRLTIRNKLDITKIYLDWFKIGMSIANTFHDDGREYFQQLSQFYPRYDPKQTGRKYSTFLKSTYNYTFGTFMHICKQYDIIREGNFMCWGEDCEIIDEEKV